MVGSEVAINARRGERVIAIALIVAMLAVMWWAFKEHIEWVGFPDGYVAELDAAENIMAEWFCWFSFGLIAALGVLIWRSFFVRIGGWLLVVAGLYLVAGVGAIALDQYFATYMMDSRGG
jgi:hypothetical protein